jgi:predicted ester cyclase
MTALERNKALSRRALMMWATGNQDDPGQVFTDDYVNHLEPAAAGGVKGLDLKSWKEVVDGHHRAFPASAVEILLKVAEGDLVATHWRFTVTNTGAYLDRPPSGKQVRWTGVQIDRFDNGKIAESWVSWDKYTQLEGLGLLS